MGAAPGDVGGHLPAHPAWDPGLMLVPHQRGWPGLWAAQHLQAPLLAPLGLWLGLQVVCWVPVPWKWAGIHVRAGIQPRSLRDGGVRAGALASAGDMQGSGLSQGHCPAPGTLSCPR